jgi:rhodanese-related sulfurtransferase
MKWLTKIQILFLAFFFFAAFQGCNKEENPVVPDPINEADVLIKYLEANGDFMNTAAPALITAEQVWTSDRTKMTILDTRTAEHFNAGHIEGAINVPLKDIVKYYRDNNLSQKEKVVIACYSGQTGGYATAILRVLGYNNVFDLKFGMSAWNDSTANSWKPVIADGNKYQSYFNTTPVAKNAAGSLPKIETGKTTGAEILEARVAKILEDGFAMGTVNGTTLFGNLTNYYIVNYWPENQYNLGHIQGSIQYTPKEDFKLEKYLNTLPTDKPIAIYCYTGQTSAHVAAILRLIGYDAKSALYGMNGMYRDLMVNNNMASGLFTENECKYYPFVKIP